jgi:hypothetical protein
VAHVLLPCPSHHCSGAARLLPPLDCFPALLHCCKADSMRSVSCSQLESSAVASILLAWGNVPNWLIEGSQTAPITQDEQHALVLFVESRCDGLPPFCSHV